MGVIKTGIKKILDVLGIRMKKYEAASDNILIDRMPIIIRIDGKAFHTFTRGMDTFDQVLMDTMAETTKYLVENIQGCVYGYTQSDEISLLLINYSGIKSEPWLGNRIQKMCSISASMATLYFNKIFVDNIYKYDKVYNPDSKVSNYSRKINSALFDSRVFNIPREEVVNYFIWRQKDAEKNSVQTFARDYFSHKELHGLSGKAIQNKLFTEKNANWNDLSCYKKRGIVVHYEETIIETSNTPTGYIMRNKAVIQNITPMLVKDSSDLENLIYVDKKDELHD